MEARDKLEATLNFEFNAKWNKFIADVKAALTKLNPEPESNIEPNIESNIEPNIEQNPEPNLLILRILLPAEQRIRNLLLQKPGLTQKQIADKLKIDRSYISKRISNKTLFKPIKIIGEKANRYYNIS